MKIAELPNLNPRNVGFDVARGVAILLMIFQHFCLLVLGNYFHNDWFSFICYIIGTVLVAPVFLFLMGVNSVSSRHNQPRQLLKKGLLLIFLGYLLSFLRFFLPLVVANHFGLIDSFENVIYKFQPIYYLLEVDILQVAGLSLLLISFLRWRKVKTKHYLSVALLMSLLSPFLWLIKSDSWIITLLTDSFWGAAIYVVFPFFSWGIYSLAGVYFGEKLINSQDKKAFYQKCFDKFLLFLIPSLLLFLIDFLFFNYSYSRHGFGYNFLFITIVIVWLSWLNLKFYKTSSKIVGFLTFLSKNITLVYFVQWILIGWLTVFINLNIFR